MKTAIVTAGLLVILAISALGTTIHVPTDQPTIQAGIDAAAESDTVLVAPGTYTGDGNRQIDFGGKNLVLRSSDGPEMTILSAEGFGEVITFHSGESRAAVLEGFQITFGGNSGIWCDGASPTIQNNLIAHNSAACGGCGHPGGASCCNWGGGIACYNGSEPLIQFNRIESNFAGNGGGIHCDSSNAIIHENVIADNFGSNPDAPVGGGVSSRNCSPTLSGNTLVGNGGGMQIKLQNAFPLVENCIIAYGGPYTDSAIGCDENSLPSIACTNIYGHQGGDWEGSIVNQANMNGNLSIDPRFCDRLAGIYSVDFVSPCLPENNTCGVQIGALGEGCQLAPPTTYHVAVDGDDVSGDGSEGNPFATIQRGIDACRDFDEVVVFDGIYMGDGNRDLDFGGRNIMVRSANGPEVTIIDCEGPEAHRGFSFHSGEFDATVAGFTVRNGSAGHGGGIECRGSSPTIVNNILVGNRSLILGGGLACIGSNASVISNRISGNYAQAEGGGIYLHGPCRATITDNTIVSNTSERSGGGIACRQLSSATVGSIIERNEIRANTSARSGGGIYWEGGSDVISHNLIADNSSQTTGGGAYFTGNTGGVSATISNNTFAGNTAGTGSAAAFSNTLFVAMESCIIAGNSGSTTILLNQPIPAEFQLALCNIYGNTGGDWTGVIADQAGINGNFSADPMFCDAANGNYHLSVLSPCASTNNPSGQLIGALEPSCGYFVCGDANLDGELTEADIATLRDAYFGTVPIPFLLPVSDMDCNGTITINDLVLMAGYYYGYGPAPCCDPPPKRPDLPGREAYDGPGQ